MVRSKAAQISIFSKVGWLKPDYFIRKSLHQIIAAYFDVAKIEVEQMNQYISVILCTHNPRKEYLARALDSLKVQTLSAHQWEFLFIDNLSNETLSDHWDLSWHGHARHIREEELGLTAARLRGIRESTGDLIVFIDDDNVLDHRFLSEAQKIFENCKHLGVFGAGRIEPEFENSPTEEVRPKLHLLALRSVVSDMWSNNPSDSRCTPWGAGLCVSRRVAGTYIELIQRLNVTSALGRRGSHLLSGEDDLFSRASVQTGLGFGIFPELALTHLISSSRLEPDYLVRLVEGHAFSHAVMDYMLSADMPAVENAARYVVRSLLHKVKNGRFSMRCQQAARRGSKRAIEYIREHDLRPVKPGSFVLVP